MSAANYFKTPALDIDRRLHGGKPGLRPDQREERRIVWRLCWRLKEEGCKVDHVWDSEGATNCADAKAAMEEVFNRDDCRVYFLKGKQRHWVYLVCGNGEDIISDWSYHDNDNFKATMEAAVDALAAELS